MRIILQKLGARRKLAKEIAREVLGFAPYERRMMSHLDNGLDKRALKLAKKRVRKRGIGFVQGNLAGMMLRMLIAILFVVGIPQARQGKARGVAGGTPKAPTGHTGSPLSTHSLFYNEM